MLLVSAPACIQDSAWERYMAAGRQANDQGDYDEAEKQVLRALQEAENFGPEDPRLAASLNNLALLYHGQGKYAEAEPLHQRSLAIQEKTLGPEHPNVAASLSNLAELYRAQGQYAEAEPLCTSSDNFGHRAQKTRWRSGSSGVMLGRPSFEVQPFS